MARLTHLHLHSEVFLFFFSVFLSRSRLQVTTRFHDHVTSFARDAVYAAKNDMTQRSKLHRDIALFDLTNEFACHTLLDSLTLFCGFLFNFFLLLLLSWLSNDINIPSNRASSECVTSSFWLFFRD